MIKDSLWIFGRIIRNIGILILGISFGCCAIGFYGGIPIFAIVKYISIFTWLSITSKIILPIFFTCMFLFASIIVGKLCSKFMEWWESLDTSLEREQEIENEHDLRNINMDELARNIRLYNTSSTADMYSSEVVSLEIVPKDAIKNEQVKPMTEIPQTRKLILGERE